MFDIFPSNGLDRSILTPVFIGLAYLVAFSEALGWPFVGMVVPGYLASVCIAAPVTGATVLGESIVTFLIGRAVGEWIPRTGAWTVSFGRERFFLLIIVSVIVRLISEGVVLPAIAEKTEFRHASELYSIGLVLVPLIANSYWNVGLKRGLSQSTVITGLTYVTVQYALLPLTNLSLSRFELTYESVALSFLASSKAYLLLLTGTLIAARNNVAYGWDYNGILVPGLLTVAWYSPFKLVTTFGEAMIVAWAIRRLIQFPFFARVLIEGPRRSFVVFLVGFLFKMVLGYGALWFFPGERVTDLYGFGYVLPTLLALKIGQKGSAGRVVMPTLQVSIAGFLGGNLLGFILQSVWPIGLMVGQVEQGVLESQPSVVRELTLQTAWAPRGIHRLDSDVVGATGRFVRELHRGSPDRSIRQLSELGLRIVQTPRPNGGRWWLIRRNRDDADHYDQLPAVAVSDSKQSSGIVVAFGSAAGPVSAIAARTAQAMDAGMIAIFPADEDHKVADRWISTLSERGGWLVIAELNVDEKNEAHIRVADARQEIRKSLMESFGKETPDHNDPYLFTLRPHEVEGLAIRAFPTRVHALNVASIWNAVRPSETDEVLEAESRAASVDEMRLFSSVLAPRMINWFQHGRAPTEYERALAALLGFSMGVVNCEDQPCLLLTSNSDFEKDVHGFTWIAFRHGDNLAVTAPSVTKYNGMHTSLEIMGTVATASHALVARGTGSVPMRSFYRRAQELLLERGARIVELKRVPRADDKPGFGVIITTGDIVESHLGVPEWTADLNPVWSTMGVGPRWYNGAQDLWPVRGTSEPLIKYARRYARGRAVIAWLGQGVWDLWDANASRIPPALERYGGAITVTSLVDELESRRTQRSLPCRLATLESDWKRFQETRHPLALQAVFNAGRSCNARMVRASETGLVYWTAHDLTTAAAWRVDGRGGTVVAHTRRDAQLFVRARVGVLRW